MNMFKRFVSGLGQQSAPFGFAPDDPNASYQAGLAYMGDLGASIMANNRGGVDPFVNLGASLQDARSMSSDRNKQQWTAARLKEEAELKRQERERADADRKRREDYINTLPADVRMKALSIPGYLDSWISANDPALQKPEEPKLYEVGDALVDANGNIVYQGQGATEGTGQKRFNVGGVLVDEYGNEIYKPDPSQKQQDMNPTELKAVFATEDELPALQGTREALDRALSLNDKTYSGIGAGARAYLGAKVLGDSPISDEQKSKNTLEWQSIMSLESISMMADSLKGATTNFELNEFKRILADPETPPDIRKRTLERMKTLADRKQQMLEGRLQMLKGQGGNGSDPLEAARDAISRGADPEAVRQRLIDNGIDPAGL